MTSSWLGVRSEGSAIGEEGNGSEDFRDLGFSRTFESEGRENERMLEFEVEVEKKKNFSNRCNSIKLYEV